MKIAQGRLRGRNIFFRYAEKPRPTMSRVRHALFNILSHKISGSRVLDLFAGSGLVGLEALSLGVEEVVFIEKDPGLVKSLRENLDSLDLSAEVLHGSWGGQLAHLNDMKQVFELIFIDPPYFRDQGPIAIRECFQRRMLSEKGVLVWERQEKEKEFPEDDCLALGAERVLSRNYGATCLDFFQYAEN